MGVSRVLWSCFGDISAMFWAPWSRTHRIQKGKFSGRYKWHLAIILSGERYNSKCNGKRGLANDNGHIYRLYYSLLKKPSIIPSIIASIIASTIASIM